MDNNIKIILFDMGRVLVKIDFDAFPNALGLFTKEQRAPYQTAAMKFEYLYECGKITTEGFLDSLYTTFNSQFTKQQLLDAYNTIIVEENSEIIPLVKRVKEKYRVALLSNTSEAHWKKSLEIAPLLQLIPEKFTSFHIGEMKPKPIVFEKVISSLQADPSSILFIDDVKENVDGAISCRMKGIVYTTVDNLEFELGKVLQ